MTTSKDIEYLHSHIKGNSVLKACWADMPKYTRENTVVSKGTLSTTLYIRVQ